MNMKYNRINNKQFKLERTQNHKLWSKILLTQTVGAGRERKLDSLL